MELAEHISKNTLKVASSINYKVSKTNGISTKGIKLLLNLHPIHVIKHQKKDKYSCIASLRNFQLAKSILSTDDLIPVLIHENTDESEIKNLASIELFLTSIVYGLDESAWADDLMKLLNLTDKKNLKMYVEETSNKSKFTKFLGLSRQSLYINKTRPLSILKEKLK